MKILTKAILNSLPRLYAQDSVADPIVHFKLFTPWTNWTWYITEGQQEDGDFRMFGLVVGQETEMGYISMNELLAVKGPMGLKIERDLHFHSGPLSTVKGK